jgi:nitroreductase/Pyruvate/2-oxoacid:ferredoxin oxidoreductase delta subunit
MEDIFYPRRIFAFKPPSASRSPMFPVRHNVLSSALTLDQSHEGRTSVMDFTVHAIIDKDICIGCGLCVKVCPFGTISMQDGKAAVTGDRSLNCGHCVSACPVDAIRVTSLDPALFDFASFHVDPRWLPHGDYDTGPLVQLMASRRSCRNYQDRPVDRSMLDDLVKIAVTAPSATNCQAWTFTLLPSREAVIALANLLADFYSRLNRLAEKWFVRSALKLVGKGDLDMYYRNYYQIMEEWLAGWKQAGRDRLLHGASAAIVIGLEPGASMPRDDAMLASQNILLAAHSMGLGTCLIGLAVKAMAQDRRIQMSLGIPARETVHSVIALGHPNEKYRTPAGRRKFPIREFNG